MQEPEVRALLSLGSESRVFPDLVDGGHCRAFTSVGAAASVPRKNERSAEARAWSSTPCQSPGRLWYRAFGRWRATVAAIPVRSLVLPWLSITRVGTSTAARVDVPVAPLSAQS